MGATAPLPNEKELLLLIAEGDEDAFRQLFHFYMPTVYPMILKVVKSDSVAEDIVQETFLRVWINRDKLTEIEQPRAWILRIAYFRAFTYLRDQSIHEKAVSGLSVDEPATQDTETRLSLRNMEQAIKKAVQQLPGQQQKVYRLSRESGYRNAEIARMMTLSEQSVKNTLVRALKFIRSELEKAGYSLFVIFWLMFIKN